MFKVLFCGTSHVYLQLASVHAISSSYLVFSVGTNTFRAQNIKVLIDAQMLECKTYKDGMIVTENMAHVGLHCMYSTENT